MITEHEANAPVIIKTKLDGPPFDSDTYVIFDEHSWNNHYDECSNFARLLRDRPEHLARLWFLMGHRSNDDGWVTLSAIGKGYDW